MRDLLFTKAAPAAFANTSSFCPRIPRRAFSPARSGISRHIFSAQRCSTWSKNQERKEGMFHVEHKRRKGSGRRKCSTWNIAQKSRKENQLKCKAKKKKPTRNGQKKYRPRRRYFYPMRAVARTTPKMKRIKIAVFRATARVAGYGAGVDYSGSKDYSSTTVVQPYLSSQRPYWISCNLL